MRALIFLAACSHAVAPPVFPSDNRWRGVPINVWHAVDLDNDGGACQPYFIEPATLCVRSGQDMQHDGCKWRCTDIDVGEEAQ